MSKVLSILSLILFLSACTINQGNYTVLSNKIINLSELDISNSTKIKNVVGKDINHRFFFFDTKPNISLQGALDNIFEIYDADIMTDARVETYSWCVPFIYAQSGWVIKGDAIKTRK